MALICENHNPPFIFVHVYRTGGLITRAMLKQVGVKTKELGNGHSMASDLAAMAPGWWNRCFRFSIVRNPFDWMLSVYCYAKLHPGHFLHKVATEMCLEPWLNHYFTKVHNQWRDSEVLGAHACTSQRSFLYAGDQCLVHYIARQETLQRDINVVFDVLRLPHQSIPKYNTCVGINRQPQWWVHYTEGAADMVRTALAEDFETFGYSKDFPDMNHYSQTNEQELLIDLCSALGIVNGKSVEFGAGDGSSNSNTRWCMEAGWKAEMWDIRPANPCVREVKVTVENINELFTAHDVADCDLLSIDVDGNDYWLWRALTHRPKVVVIEYNQNLPAGCRRVMKHDENHCHDGTSYYGASYLALCDLAAEKGYAQYASTALNIIFYDLAADPHGKIVPRGPLTPTHSRSLPDDQKNRPWVELPEYVAPPPPTPAIMEGVPA